MDKTNIVKAEDNMVNLVEEIPKGHKAFKYLFVTVIQRQTNSHHHGFTFLKEL